MANQRILVLAPHPDDELLGVGGTMARCAAEGAEVYVAILTKGYPPQFKEEFIEAGRREVREAHRLLGVQETIMLTLPTAAVDTLPQRDVNGHIQEILAQTKPDTVYIPFEGDLHRDHQLFAQATLVATRPSKPNAPTTVLAYETLSETNWNAPYLSPAFQPQVFVDISNYLDKKLAAIEIVKSQVQDFPHERSLEALQALARLRGATVHRHAAEAFVLIRQIVDSDNTA